MHLKSALVLITLTWASASWSHPGHPALTAPHTHTPFAGDVLFALAAAFIAAALAIRHRHAFRSDRTRKH